MGSSLAERLAPTHSKSVGAGLDVGKPKAAKVGIGGESTPTAANPEPEPFLDPKLASVALIDEARIRAGLTHKEMYLAAPTDKSEWSKAMNGERNFPTHWLTDQPTAFWVAYIRIVQLKYGLDRQTTTEVRAKRIGQLVEELINATEVA